MSTTPFQAMVLDHRSGDWRQADSKPELGRLLFGYVLGNGQKFPPRPNDVRFLGKDFTLSGHEALVYATRNSRVPFDYRGEDGAKRDGELFLSRTTKNVRIR